MKNKNKVVFSVTNCKITSQINQNQLSIQLCPEAILFIIIGHLGSCCLFKLLFVELFFKFCFNKYVMIHISLYFDRLTVKVTVSVDHLSTNTDTPLLISNSTFCNGNVEYFWKLICNHIANVLYVCQRIL